MNIHDFEDQVKYLTEANYYFPTWDEVEDYIAGNILLPEKSIVLTFDDGDPSFFKYTAPLIEKYGIRGTCFIIGIKASREQLDQTRSDRVHLQSHSWDLHKWGEADGGLILSSSPEWIASDLAMSYDLLGTKQVYCYPYGHFTYSAIDTLRAEGVHLAFTTVEEKCFPLMNTLKLPRLRISEGITVEEYAEKIVRGTP
jgi:peptidoglycan/xylan/chitin deacetylase (PgdA/CDA1 family)